MQRSIVLLSILCFAIGYVSSQFDPNIAKTVLSLIDLTVDPCDDFYHFACGTWLNETVIPSDKSIISRSFTTIEQHNKDILLDILNSGGNKKLTDFYNSCLDMDSINNAGWKPIQEDLKLVQLLDSEGLFFVLGQLWVRGIDSFFSLAPVVDGGNPQIVIGQLDQGGLGLPYPELYTGTDPDTKKIQTQYITLMQTLFTLIDDSDPVSSAKDAYTVESTIAGFTVSQDALTDPFTTYNPMSADEFVSAYPEYESFFLTLLVFGGDIQNLTITVPTFFSNLSSYFSSSQQLWSSYLRWNVLRTRAPLLSSPFRDAYFNFFNVILAGQKTPTPLSEQCADTIDSSLGELLGFYFNERAFPGESKTEALEILTGIQSAMNYDINNINWMDSTTRERALTKLSLVTHLIGAPDDPDTYTIVNVTNVFFNNRLMSIIYGRIKNLEKIGKPTDKTEFDMTAPTVNAYYDPSRNQMVFVSGILQQPFFNVSYPKSMNYGGIGLVMGHELTHGFDNQGRLYDGTGLLKNWWTDQTNQLFNQKVQCVIDQYSKFEILPGVFVNGKLTQGENIADMGGIKNAFHAYSQVEDITLPSIVQGYNKGQLFFLAYAQTWCQKATDAHYRVSVKTDPHSPGIFRVLGPLMNLPSFGDVWKCPTGSRMNNPATRCEVW